MSLRTTLMEEFDSTIKAMKKMQYGSDEFKAAGAHALQLADRITRLQELEEERNEKIISRKNEEDFKNEQLKFEKKKEWIRNGITIGTTVFSTAVLIWGTIGTWGFDAKHTTTSTQGRGWLNMLYPKWLKQ